MSANKIIKSLELSPELAERLQKRLAEDRSEVSRVLIRGIGLYLDFRDIGDYSQDKR
jgi:hypothetical protein